MTERAINMRAKKFMELQAEMAELKAQMEKIKKEIQDEMGMSEELNTEKYLIKWIFVNKAKFDTKTFKVEHPDLYNIFAKDSAERRFTVAAKEA